MIVTFNEVNVAKEQECSHNFHSQDADFIDQAAIKYPRLRWHCSILWIVFDRDTSEALLKQLLERVSWQNDEVILFGKKGSSLTR